VARIPTGVAVVAETFDQALAGRDALAVDWSPGPSAHLSDADVRSLLAGAVPSFGPPLPGVRAVERTFDFAFVPHAPLEVLNCVADVRPDRAELWLPASTTRLSPRWRWQRDSNPCRHLDLRGRRMRCPETPRLHRAWSRWACRYRVSSSAPRPPAYMGRSMGRSTSAVAGPCRSNLQRSAPKAPSDRPARAVQSV
jgi:hypothetical protein